MSCLCAFSVHKCVHVCYPHACKTCESRMHTQTHAYITFSICTTGMSGLPDRYTLNPYAHLRPWLGVYLSGRPLMPMVQTLNVMYACVCVCILHSHVLHACGYHTCTHTHTFMYRKGTQTRTIMHVHTNTHKFTHS